MQAIRYDGVKLDIWNSQAICVEFNFVQINIILLTFCFFAEIGLLFLLVLPCSLHDTDVRYPNF